VERLAATHKSDNRGGAEVTADPGAEPIAEILFVRAVSS
jgi:hypothetical protein